METKAIIHEFLTSQLIKDKSVVVDDETPLLTSGLVDSLGIVRLTAFIEDRLGVKVPLEDITIENFEALGLLVAYLQTRTGA